MRFSQPFTGWGFWLLAAFAISVRTAPAQTSTEKSVLVKEGAESSSIFDIVVDLFGGDSSSETLQPVPEDATTPPQVPVLVNDVPQTPASSPAGKQNAKVEIQTTYADAVREAQLHNRPVLAVLGAEWCVWCRKLEAELATPAAESILKEWVVVRVDVDDEPEVATRLQASALPALRVLGPFQALVSSREGYVELAELKQWLAENRASADPALHKVLYDTAVPDKAAIDQLVSMLSQSAPMVRAAAMQRLAAHSRHTASALVQTLKTGRLVQQLCATEVLRRCGAPVGSIDPWQPDTLDSDDFAKLVDWSRARMDSENRAEPIADAHSAATAAPPTIDSEVLDDLVVRLIAAEPNDRPSLIAQLLNTGAPLAVVARSRLAQEELLEDAAREALRELLFNSLASGQLRLEQSGVITALARLDSETHRQAAATILDEAAIVDQPLIDELVRDADPLIRELAVRALGRLGLLTRGDRIQHLLTDTSPNVRTAVLRALTERPSEQAVEALCTYLQQETDEDLLVHGAKCLGQLARQPKALDTLAHLASNSSWCVRATAVEAAGQTINNRPPNGWGSQGSPAVPEVLASAIVAAAFEEDAFVAERAAALLPTLLNNGVVDEPTLETIAKNLAEHPEKLDSLGSSSRTTRIRIPSVRQQSYPALVNVAKKWLTQDDPKNIERAAILLSRFDAPALNDRLGSLIASKDRSMRMAGLRAAIDSVEKYRRTSVEAAVRAWRVKSDEAHPRRQPPITPWYESPISESATSESTTAATPVPGKPPAQEADTGKSSPRPFDAVTNLFGGASPTPADSRRPQSSALDVADDMFGDFPATQSAVTGGRKAQPEKHDVAALALPSKWMEHWQSGQSQNRPSWLSACEEPTKALLNSADAQERAAALALWLMLGHTDRTSELFTAIEQSREINDTDEGFVDAAQLSTWLPSNERLNHCKELVAAQAGDVERIVETLEQITVVDDAQIANWLYEYLAQEPLSDRKFQQQLAGMLLRALVGFTAETLPSSLSPGDFQFSSELPYRVMRAKTLFAIPRRIAACEWLRYRFHEADSTDHQRAISLAAVARLDHKTAVDAALDAIEEAEVDGELLQTALTIALNDAAAPSAERAMTLLGHQVPAVRNAALQLLATPRSQAQQHRQPFLPSMQENFGVLPGFWPLKHTASVEILRELVDSETDPLQQSQAILLLLAAGERADLAALERQLTASHAELTKLMIAAALAKGGRTDEDAVKYYEQVYAESSTPAGGGDDRIAAALYAVLRDLSGQPIIEMRRRMRNEKGSNLFNSNSATDDIFGVP